MIEKEKYYSVNYLFQNNIFPWFKSHMSITNFIESTSGTKLLKPVVKKTSRRTSYYIRGENILDVLELARKGEFIFKWESLSSK